MSSREFIGSAQLIDFTERTGRITKRLMWPVRESAHPLAAILRWTEAPAAAWAIEDAARALSGVAS